MNSNNMASTIWSVADLLRGSCKRSEYGRVILPFTLLLRIEGILQPTREAVLAEHERLLALNAKARAEAKAKGRENEALGSERIWKNREEFTKALKKVCKAAGVTLAPPQLKALLQALSERDAEADICLDAKGKPEPDTEARDVENIPLGTDIEEYFAREVRPHVPDAWMDRSKDKIGYEIPFNRHFYVYTPPRPLEEIDAELKAVSSEIMDLLREVSA